MDEKTFKELLDEFNGIKAKVLDLQDQANDFARQAQELRAKAAAMVPKLHEAELAEKKKNEPKG